MDNAISSLVKQFIIYQSMNYKRYDKVLHIAYLKVYDSGK
jgi:hypothetical protein